MLERVGFEVITAADGFEAVEIFAKKSEVIKFVLLDITMPRMNGKEALLKIKQIRSDVPVILSSGYDRMDIANEFVGKRSVGFIRKPYVFGNLIAKVQELL